MELDFICLECNEEFTDEVDEDELGYVQSIDVDCPNCGSSDIEIA
jgi:DNA-directed RNA polymerase subunit RPC12/RpoP